MFQEICWYAIGWEGDVDRWQQIRFEPPCNQVLFVGVSPSDTGAPEDNKSKRINGAQ